MNFWPDTDNWERAQRELHESGVTDGLPVVPPTRARVEHMLALHGFAADDVIADVAPLYAPATWRDIAMNAVLAGALPEYLPLIGAAVEAVAADEFNLMGVSTTTGAAAPVIFVNGPGARKLRMNGAGNALGSGNQANATIGRALALVLRNVGGACPGEFDMATLGQPAKYTCCFAENEEESPWPPFHVERGLTADASAVTAVASVGNVEVADACSSAPEDLAQTFAESMLIAGTAGRGGLVGGGEPLIVMPPEIAHAFHGAGYSKADTRTAIFERARMPLSRLSPAVRRHVTDLQDGRAPAELRVANEAQDILIVVAGGSGAKAAYIPTWPGGTRAVTRRVRDVTDTRRVDNVVPLNSLTK